MSETLEQPNGVLTPEQEKDIGMATRLINVASTNVLALVVLVPTAYMMVEGVTIQEAWWTIVGGVIGYYFKK